MYRVYLGSRTILGMADPLNELYVRMSERSWILLKHVGKCILWGKHYHSYNHWIHEEISSYINEFARKKTKSSLNEKLVRKNLFGRMGTEYYDALNILWDIYDESQRDPNPYPKLDIVDEYGESFFKAYNELADLISFYLANHKHRSRSKNERLDYRDEIDPLVYKVLNKYC